MILVVVTAERVSITGHATSAVACAAVSAVAQMLRFRSVIFDQRKPSEGPSVAVFVRSNDSLSERSLVVLKQIARTYKAHVRYYEEP